MIYIYIVLIVYKPISQLDNVLQELPYVSVTLYMKMAVAQKDNDNFDMLLSSYLVPLTNCHTAQQNQQLRSAPQDLCFSEGSSTSGEGSSTSTFWHIN